MRETGLSRKTVRKYLRGVAKAKAKYGPREARPCKLDPFKSYLSWFFVVLRPCVVSFAVAFAIKDHDLIRRSHAPKAHSLHQERQ